MNKNKKLVADLREYLGRDKDGLEKLDKISRAMIELNKDLAAERETNQRLREALQVRSEEIDKRDSQILTMKQDADRTEARIVQADRDIDSLEKSLVELERKFAKLSPDLPEPVRDEDCPAALGLRTEGSRLSTDPGGYKRTFNILKDDMKVAPAPTLSRMFRIPEPVGKVDAFYFYEITDICQGYSIDDMARLGRFTAAMALMNFPSAIMAKENFGTPHRGKKCSANQIKKFMLWFRPNNIRKATSLEEKCWAPILHDGTTSNRHGQLIGPSPE